MLTSEKKRAAVITDSHNLYRKIALELIDEFDTVKLERGEATDEYDAVFVDADSIDGDARGIRMTRGEARPGELALPFRLGEALRLATSASDEILGIAPDAKCAILRGRRIALTEVEFSLFSLLYEKRGEYVLREDILRKVWGDGADKGVINVYVHYLREKLEKSGERIILSSRNQGYKIDEKYFTEEVSYVKNN